MNMLHFSLKRQSIVVALIFAAVFVGSAPISVQAGGITPLEAGVIGAGVGVGGTLLYQNLTSGAANAAAGTAAGITNTASAADTECISLCKQQQSLASSQNNPSLNCLPVGRVSIACASPSSGGIASGHCEMTGCKAVSVTGLNGASSAVGAGSLNGLLQAVGGLLGQLISSGSGSSDSGSTAATTCPGGYYQVSSPSTDPCAEYVPAPTVTTATTTIPTIPTIPTVPTTPTSTTDTATTTLNSDLTATVTGTFTPPSAPVATSSAGISGMIQTIGSGATFVTNDIEGNSETSSFFGGDAIGGFVSNLIGGWCASRPWASGFIASIIPPSFFDSLCTQNGFTVGNPAPTPAAASTATAASVTLTQTPVIRSKPTVAQVLASSTPLVPPRVDIWAVPPSVPLGSRATIFWNTENVTNCTETSPDGSFSQTSLSGGAATVPLTGSTVYTISCLDTQGNPATDYVTVNISG